MGNRDNYIEVDDDCNGPLEEYRSRCQNFWEFVDSDPKLRNLIKEGKYWHESRPQKLDSKYGCCIFSHKNDTDQTSSNTCTSQVQKIRETRAALREKFEKRCAKTRELQMKSKQPFIKYKPPRKVNLEANLFSDMVRQDLDLELASTDEYDHVMNNMSKKTKSQMIGSTFHLHSWNTFQLEYPGEGYCEHEDIANDTQINQEKIQVTHTNNRESSEDASGELSKRDGSSECDQNKGSHVIEY